MVITRICGGCGMIILHSDEIWDKVPYSPEEVTICEFDGKQYPVKLKEQL